MTTTEKVLFAIIGGGSLYLLLAGRAPAPQPIPAHLLTTYQRVMGYAGYMLQHGAEQRVEPALIAAVITVESSGRADAVGAAGEIGLMQILPSTAEWFGNISAQELRDPETNIQFGAAYLGYCIDRNGGNVPAGIAGYNYGPDRVRVEGNQVIVPEGVLRYMTKVLSHVEYYRQLLRHG